MLLILLIASAAPLIHLAIPHCLCLFGSAYLNSISPSPTYLHHPLAWLMVRLSTGSPLTCLLTHFTVGAAVPLLDSQPLSNSLPHTAFPACPACLLIHLSPWQQLSVSWLSCHLLSTQNTCRDLIPKHGGLHGVLAAF